MCIRDSPRSPKEAQDIGIGFVHQELSLCPHLTAAENIFIGRLPHKGGMIDFKRLWADADMVLKQFNANFPSSALVSELTVSEPVSYTHLFRLHWPSRNFRHHSFPK